MSFVHPGYPTLTYSQLEQVWIQAGGSKAVAPLMAAIAKAESGGIAGNTNPTDNNGTQTSWGLWQISDGTHGWSYGGDPYDPLTNAKAAVMKYHSQGLAAWGTYTSGAYKQYLQGNVPPGTGTLPTGGSGTTVTTPGSGFAQTPVDAGFLNVTLPDLNPLHAVESVVGDVGGLVKGAFGFGNDLIKTMPDAVKALAKAVGVIAEVFSGLLWLLNPSNDLRVLSGLTGLIVLMIALYLVATA